MTITTKHLWYFFISANLLSFSAIAIDTITPIQPLTKNQILVSPGKLFELGFFNPENSKKSYIGIWYKDFPDKTIVWIANRDNPITNSPGVLKIGENGNIELVDGAANSIWSSNISKSRNTVARLLDSGNFVLYDENDDGSKDYLWQSFDYPTDTLLPGMKLGWDRKTGLNRYLTSWRKYDDPSSGDYTFKLDINGYPDIHLSYKQVVRYRSGPWNGESFSGVPEMKHSPTFTFSVEVTEDDIFYLYGLHNKSLLSRLVMSDSGKLQRYLWMPTSKTWNLFWYAMKDQCDNFGECGVYGVCDANRSPNCICVKGFQPKNSQAWLLRDGSGGCVRKHKLDCEDDGFVIMGTLKLPYSATAFVDPNMSLDECRNMCMKNCSCTAYSNSNMSAGGSGCVIWATDLLDMRQYTAAEGGQDLYVRVATSDSDQTQNGYVNLPHKSKHILIIAVIIAGLGVIFSGIIASILWRRKRLKVQSVPRGIKADYKGPIERSQDLLLNSGILRQRDCISGEIIVEEFELPLIDFATIALATENFSDDNKLGKGGFGVVYKGILGEGEEVAVKRLSKTSTQGIEELKNEVKLIARLQHRNLVRLIGCCIDVEEKLLIYEYMENNSLDSIIFNKVKNSLLNWEKRFNIILGIARGLVYLHQDSRFRIIHRDLKASNVLLGKEMEPKISDFGMARIFGGDQVEASTMRVVGTYGYMSPEYAMDGVFSIKSDVFSYGVLILEIISGMKNRGFYKTKNHLNLLAYAWKLWREGRGIELVDPAAGYSYSKLEVIRCIQVGLLCVQEQAEDRPTMGNVVLMLSSETMLLTQPKQPGFCCGRRPFNAESSTVKPDESSTINQVTVTTLDGR